MNFRIFILVVILLYSLITSYSLKVGCIDKEEIIKSLVVSFIALSIYITRKEYFQPLKKQFFSIANILVLSIFSVHFLQYINYAINENDVLFLSDNVINKASRISSTCFTALIIGLISHSREFKESIKEKHVDASRILLIFFSFSLFLFVAFAGPQYFTAGGNSMVLNGEGMNPVAAVGNVTCIASVIASVVNVIQKMNGQTCTIIQYVKKFPILFWVLTFVYMALVLISGDRGPIIDIAISLFVGCLMICKIKVGTLTSLTIIIIAAFILTFMSFLRGNNMELSFDKLVIIYDRFLSFLDTSDIFFALTRELSIVVNSFHLVLEYTEKNDIVYGAGIIFQLLAILPGIRSLMWSFSGIDITVLSTDALATKLLNEGIGAGTTCIADSYYNLGLLGSIIFFVLCGHFLRRVDISLYNHKCKTIYLVIGICYMARAIYIGRSTLLQPINLIFYTSLYLYFSRKLTKYF